MPNTGYVGCLFLEQYYLDTNLPTGVVVPNHQSHPAYIPPTFNPGLCPVGSPLPTPTPTPTLPPPIPIPMLGGLRMNNGSGPQVVNLTGSDDFRFTNFGTSFSLFVELTAKAATIAFGEQSVIISALTTNVLDNSGWWFYLEGNELKFNITPLNVTITCNVGDYATLIKDVRMNFAVTYSSSTNILTLYRNGVYINDVFVDSNDLVVPTSATVQLGGDTVNAGSIGYTLFDGILWNVFFYDRALSPLEVATLDAGNEVDTPFAKYYLNEDTGTTAADSSLSLLPGVLSGYSGPEVSPGASNNWVEENETPKV